ncbi:MAG: hypothetical protein AAF670_02775 [Planctomycetota bacterium]
MIRQSWQFDEAIQRAIHLLTMKKLATGFIAHACTVTRERVGIEDATAQRRV